MSQLPTQIKGSFRAITKVGVGVEVNLQGDGYTRLSHCVMLYMRNGVLFRLHLCTDGKVREKAFDESKEPTTFFAPALDQNSPSLDEMLNAIARFCRYVVKRTPSLVYSFQYAKGTKLVDKGKTIGVEPDGVGLSCTTFVLALLEGQGVTLLDVGDWKQRRDDERVERILAGFATAGAAYGLTPEIGKEIPCLRYRAEDAVAGCLLGSHNVSFDQAWPKGVEVLYLLDHNKTTATTAP
jgi:hypothetical protein